MDKEKFTISLFKNHFTGDDCAVLSEKDVKCDVWCKDLFCENSHFKRGWLSPYEIGRKAVMVNFSDIIAMNAKPKFMLLGLGFPKNTSLNFIREMARGINETCEKFGCVIIGGDTIASDNIVLSVTVGGVKCGKILKRNRLKTEYLIGFTGTLGGSLKALRTLSNGGKVGKNSRFKNVVLRDKFVRIASSAIEASMDISDGLSSDLAKFTRNVGLKFIKKPNKTEMKSGEEYEILFACKPQNKLKIIKAAQKSRTKVTFFAKTVRGKYKNYGKNEHF